MLSRNSRSSNVSLLPRGAGDARYPGQAFESRQTNSRLALETRSTEKPVTLRAEVCGMSHLACTWGALLLPVARDTEEGPKDPAVLRAVPITTNHWAQMSMSRKLREAAAHPPRGFMLLSSSTPDKTRCTRRPRTHTGNSTDAKRKKMIPPQRRRTACHPMSLGISCLMLFHIKHADPTHPMRLAAYDLCAQFITAMWTAIWGMLDTYLLARWTGVAR